MTSLEAVVEDPFGRIWHVGGSSGLHGLLAGAKIETKHQAVTVVRAEEIEASDAGFGSGHLEQGLNQHLQPGLGMNTDRTRAPVVFRGPSRGRLVQRDPYSP